MMESVFQETASKMTKSVINLEIFLNLLYFKKLILNSPYNDKKNKKIKNPLLSFIG